MFRLGSASAEVTAFSATPEFFESGDGIDISLTVSSTGSITLTGQVIIEAQTADGITTTATFTHPVSALAPGSSLTFNDTWDTTGVPFGDYRVRGYMRYEAMTSNVAVVAVTNQLKAYLPLVLRE